MAKAGPVLCIIGGICVLIAGLILSDAIYELADTMNTYDIAWTSIGLNPTPYYVSSAMTCLWGVLAIVGGGLVLKGHRSGCYLALFMGLGAVIGMFIPIFGTQIVRIGNYEPIVMDPVYLSGSLFFIDPILILIGGIISTATRNASGIGSVSPSYQVPRNRYADAMVALRRELEAVPELIKAQQFEAAENKTAEILRRATLVNDTQIIVLCRKLMYNLQGAKPLRMQLQKAGKVSCSDLMKTLNLTHEQLMDLLRAWKSFLPKITIDGDAIINGDYLSFTPISTNLTRINPESTNFTRLNPEQTKLYGERQPFAPDEEPSPQERPPLVSPAIQKIILEKKHPPQKSPPPEPETFTTRSQLPIQENSVNLETLPNCILKLSQCIGEECGFWKDGGCSAK